MKTLLIFIDPTGKEIARYWVVQNRKWDTTAKTFGEVVFVRVGEQWPKP